MVRCKFRVTEASPKESKGPHTVKLEAVIDGSPENKQFFQWTPSGRIELAVVKDQHFAVGEEIYVDFTPCGKSETVAEAAKRGFNS